MPRERQECHLREHADSRRDGRPGYARGERTHRSAILGDLASEGIDRGAQVLDLGLQRREPLQ
jgi:hypothetical protein